MARTICDAAPEPDEDEARIAQVMSENDDDPNFDRLSALAAIEAEDMGKGSE